MMSDDQARKEIISNVNMNYFVEAGAGSGKTTILVERMVAMVEQGFPVEKICTITFTKAAANEFYARFQKRLSERSKDEPAKSHHAGQLVEQTAVTKKRCAEALRNIDSCFMGTIDSFCNMIISEHPLEAGVPADSAVIEEEGIIKAYLKEYSRIMADDSYVSLRDKYAVFVRIQSKPEETFAAVLSTVLQIRDAIFEYEKPDYQSLEKKYASDIKGLRNLFNVLSENEDLAYLNAKSDPIAWDALKQRKDALTEYNWDNYFTFVLDSLKKVEKLRIKPVDDLENRLGKAFYRIQAHQTTKKAIPCYELAEEGYKDILGNLKDYQARVALDFVVECVSKMSDVLKSRGELTFFDYKLYLKEMLKKDASGNHKLIEHIYDRHKYFLIDEFQDTDPMQAEIFFYLAAERFDPDWRKCIPHEGSLFIVGDPKQSIYRFKNADVASFKNVRSLFVKPNGKVLKLTSNFRSTYSLHQWFNKVFGEHLLAEETEDQSRYELITNKDSDDGYLTGVYKYTPEEVKDDSQEVLNMVNTLVNNPEITIGENRMIQYSDIMIITGKKKNLSRYVSAFTAANIPFKVEGNMDFNECPALIDLVAVFKAVVDPRNNYYLYEALISRIFNISPKTMMGIKASLKQMRQTGYFETENTEVIASVESIRKYTEKVKEMAPSALLSILLDDFRIFAVSGNRNEEYVYYVLELLREKEATGEIASCEEAIKYLDDLLSDNNGLERCASLQKNNNRVHLANLHKVKGLEAEVVILAGTVSGSGSRRPGKRVEYEGDQPRCYMFEIGNTVSFNDKYNKKEREKESEEAERVRQLYVAATRARRILIIGDAKPWLNLSQFADQDFFAEFSVRNVKPAEPVYVDGDGLYNQAESIIKSESISRKSSIEIHKPSDIEYDEVREAPQSFNYKRDPKLIGTLVHKFMEVLVSSGNRISTDELISDLCGELDKDGYYAGILQQVNDRIQNGGYEQNYGVPADILHELLSADEVYCEVPFSINNGPSNITTGIIDVLYRKNEEWHILDYKTNSDGNDLDKEYEEQLKEYKNAVSIQGIEPSSVNTYHIAVI